MLLQQGHNWRMDWWSLGLLFHEMASAKHPFHGPSHYDTLRNMVTKAPNIDSRISQEAGDVMKLLLVKSPKNRLCSKEGIAELKRMKFFIELDWNGLFDKTMPMPYSPVVNDAMDTSSFETTFTNEAPVDSIVEKAAKSTKGSKKGFLGFFGFGGTGENSKKVEEEENAAGFEGFSFNRLENNAGP
jgi:serine/threonine protein kinase